VNQKRPENGGHPPRLPDWHAHLLPGRAMRRRTLRSRSDGDPVVNFEVRCKRKSDLGPCASDRALVRSDCLQYAHSAHSEKRLAYTRGPFSLAAECTTYHPKGAGVHPRVRRSIREPPRIGPKGPFKIAEPLHHGSPFRTQNPGDPVFTVAITGQCAQRCGELTKAHCSRIYFHRNRSTHTSRARNV